MLKEIAIFLLGGATGAGITYYVCKKIFDNELAKMDPANDRLTADESDKALGAKELMDKLTELGYAVYSEEEYTAERERVNPIEDDDDEEEDAIPAPVEVDPNPNPYEIASREFGQIDHYETVTLSWYNGDKTMGDEDNDVLIGWTDLVGNIESRLSTAKGDAIYIRNEVSEIDYEILIYADSYSHAVMGEEDDEPGDMAD